MKIYICVQLVEDGGYVDMVRKDYESILNELKSRYAEYCAEEFTMNDVIPEEAYAETYDYFLRHATEKDVRHWAYNFNYLIEEWEV